MENNNQHTDYIVIGSGFGGSVSAMRLTEKGYSVRILEKGKEYTEKDFPKSNWNVRKFLWAPMLKCFGFMGMEFFKEVLVLNGVGVGGGSLVYANTHMTPSDDFFNNKAWKRFKNWKTTLAPFYEQAKFMLGTTKNPRLDVEDEILREVARDMDMEDSFSSVNVGVYFGDRKEAKDPYFKGLGPERKGCIECAGCMVGCRYNSKNSLDKNYLYFARKWGAKLHAETEVVAIEHKDGLYHIHTEKSTSWFTKEKETFTSKGLIMSAGVLGTMSLLLKAKHETKNLSKISDKLGHNLRTNSESICGVASAPQKMNNGLAISSTFNPDAHTHIEVVKYPNGSGAMGRLGMLATGPGSSPVRTLKLIGNMITQPIKALKTMFNFNFSPNAVILLVMQSYESAMKMTWKKGWFGSKLSIKNKGEEQVPAYIPAGQDVMHRYAEKSGGIAINAVTEIMFNMSTTAHIMGGCPMGETAEEGVLNEKFEVHNYKNMYVIDGSIIPCNLGVNPSLTITTLAEYTMSNIPQKEGNTRKTLVEQMKTS